MVDKIVTLAEAKTHLSQLTELTAAGETVIITKHGKPVAKVSPPDIQRKPISLEALRELTSTLPPQTETAGDFVRRMRDNERF